MPVKTSLLSWTKPPGDVTGYRLSLVKDDAIASTIETDQTILEVEHSAVADRTVVVQARNAQGLSAPLVVSLAQTPDLPEGTPSRPYIEAFATKDDLTVSLLRGGEGATSFTIKTSGPLGDGEFSVAELPAVLPYVNGIGAQQVVTVIAENGTLTRTSAPTHATDIRPPVTPPTFSVTRVSNPGDQGNPQTATITIIEPGAGWNVAEVIRNGVGWHSPVRSFPFSIPGDSPWHGSLESVQLRVFSYKGPYVDEGAGEAYSAVVRP